MGKEHIVVPIQPYMVLAGKNYHRMYENRLGISHFYQMDLKDRGNLNAVPDGCIDLVFHIAGDKVETSIGGTVLKAKNWILGDGGSCFGVRFLPGSAMLPEEFDAQTLVNQDLRIDGNLFGDSLEEKLMEAQNLEERAEIFLKEYDKMKHKDGDEMKKGIEEYLKKRICETHGNITVSMLTEETGYSECYIRRIFKSYHGISPKQFARYIRFQGLLMRLMNTRDTNEDLALGCGYYDEAHMMKEFREYAGMTMEEYRKIIVPKKEILGLEEAI